MGYMCSVYEIIMFISSLMLYIMNVYVDDAFVKTRSELEEEQTKRYKSEQDQIQHMKV